MRWPKYVYNFLQLRSCESHFFVGKNRLGSDEERLETAEEMKKSMTEEEWEMVYTMSKDKNLYQNLIQSLFPTIYGNEEIKRGILLMLFGGVPKTTPEGGSLRSDLTIGV